MNGGALLNVVGPSEKQYMGKPCKRGHSGLRYKSSGDCVDCAKTRARNWQRQRYQTDLVWRDSRLTRSRIRRQRKYHADPEWRKKVLEQGRSWRRKPGRADRINARTREWQQEREERASAKRRRLAKISRLAEHPEASPAEREVARRKLALLNERMIHELGQRH